MTGNKTRILVTGSNGSIGSSLVTFLHTKPGYEIFGLDKSPAGEDVSYQGENNFIDKAIEFGLSPPAKKRFHTFYVVSNNPYRWVDVSSGDEINRPKDSVDF